MPDIWFFFSEFEAQRQKQIKQSKLFTLTAEAAIDNMPLFLIGRFDLIGGIGS